MTLGEGYQFQNVINFALTLKESEQGRSLLQLAEEEAFGNLWQNKAFWPDH
ncbi:hypothetical protein HB364_12130 [Pseudoflavitalea sp. X16]|uniref:hypothetical protein n=1 Tax=Paraflavitalea devenefica TaxID=2716334 RepID=UPI00142395BE|nr:hypothetical protein [Paraflavitalea devenefica]NII25837.1 hypothetical protein [Paraflavitalea devenefica]